jgi:Protein of unknown function (DUF2934)
VRQRVARGGEGAYTNNMTTSRDGKKVPSRSRKTNDLTVAPMRTSKKPGEASEPAVRAPDTTGGPAESISDDERARKISEQAYLIAEARGFEPGHELEDWLTAERAVDARLAGTPHE